MIGSKDLFEKQSKILNYRIQLNEILNINQSKTKLINIINVKYKFKKPFSKITNISNKYISNCFDLSLKIIKKNHNIALINGPISKKHFLKKKYPGITEYIAKKTSSKSLLDMLILSLLLEII